MAGRRGRESSSGKQVGARDSRKATTYRRPHDLVTLDSRLHNLHPGPGPNLAHTSPGPHPLEQAHKVLRLRVGLQSHQRAAARVLGLVQVGGHEGGGAGLDGAAVAALPRVHRVARVRRVCSEVRVAIYGQAYGSSRIRLEARKGLELGEGL